MWLNSVVPAVSKLLKRAVYNQQFGFRPHHSTQTALIYGTDNMIRVTSKGYVTGAIFVDLKKAFHTVTVDQNVLILEKLLASGVRGHELQWL